ARKEGCRPIKRPHDSTRRMSILMNERSIPISPPAVVPIAVSDRRYPPTLHAITDPPAMLYAWGNISLLRRDALAVVSTRTHTRWGAQIAHRIAQDVARAGYVVVSGLAQGIDAAAHQGALDAGGATIAVVASSLPDIYPMRHTSLARRIRREEGL